MNDALINAAICTLRELSATITPRNVWVVLDLQGIADDISYKDIEDLCRQLNGEGEKRSGMECAWAE